MAHFSKADIQNARLESDACFHERLDTERKNFETMTADEAKVCNDLCHSLKLYYAHASDDASLQTMMRSGVDFNFINTRGLSGKYVAKKVYELAEYLAAVSGKLDMYDLVVFRTLYNFTKAGTGATREHLKAAIDHGKCDTNDTLVFRIANFRKGTGTSAPQHGSSLASFKVYGIVKSMTCADTGATLYSLNMESHATRAMLARLSLEA